MMRSVRQLARASRTLKTSHNTNTSPRAKANLAYLFLCTGAFSPVRAVAGRNTFTFAQRSIVSTIAATAIPSSSTSPMEPQYWNRELSARQSFDSTVPISKEARIICVGNPDDDANMDVYRLAENPLPGIKLLQIGNSKESFNASVLQEQGANVLFVSGTAQTSEIVAYLLNNVASIEWVHVRSAGIDFVASDALTRWSASDCRPVVTNAKGSFSSTLAEYTMLACSYFAKDLPRLMRNKENIHWEKYPIQELRGATLGIIGYGDIGKAAARLAHAYGMKVRAMKRRKPADDVKDPIAEVIYGNSKSELQRLFASCDYVLCAMPLTSETKGMIGKAEFDAAKDGAVFINVGRGHIVDEEEMIVALQDGRLKGVGLDVFAAEPLPSDSPLWKLDNVLLSPHNMDMTETFMAEASQFFVEENLPRFIRKQTLLNPVDPAAGY